MKLLNITTSYILILIFTALGLWSIFFYYSIKSEFYENVDEFLKNRKYEILKETKLSPALIEQSRFPKTDFKIEKTNRNTYKNIKETLSDIEVFEPLEKEYEPYRKLQSKFKHKEEFYKLSIVASLLDTEELIHTIRDWVIILYAILVFLLFVFNRLILERLWRPFYVTLQNLKKYRLDKDPELSFDKTYISEFNELNSTVSSLIQKNHQTFQDQKQFIENASHEMQTPLAKAASKIENLIQNPDLSQETANGIQSINDDIERLSGLNKTLLLLSKIENDQFDERTQINIGEKIDSICEDYQEFIEFKKIRLIVNRKSDLLILANEHLIEVLLRNLIKNSIYHNIPDGMINIEIIDNSVTLRNSGLEYQGDTKPLFQRFVKLSNNRESLGLGLSIVKAICDLYKYHIEYSIQGKIHQFTVDF